MSDSHRAQQRDNIKTLLARTKTQIIPVQPLDVSFNRPCNARITKYSEEHVSKNLKRYAEGKVPVSERRILLTKRIVEAWEETSVDIVIRAFKKCGISSF